MPRLQLRAALLAALAFLHICTGSGRADPIVTGTATLQADGFYLYQYTLTNPSTSNIALQGFAISGNYADQQRNFTQTGGWRQGEWIDGFDQWINTPIGQLANTTSTFSFISPLGPGTVTYAVVGPNYAFDPTLPPGSPPVIGGVGGVFEGTVVGPDNNAPIAPEPSSAVLLATAGGLLLLRRLRRKSATLTAS